MTFHLKISLQVFKSDVKNKTLQKVIQKRKKSFALFNTPLFKCLTGFELFTSPRSKSDPSFDIKDFYSDLNLLSGQSKCFIKIHKLFGYNFRNDKTSDSISRIRFVQSEMCSVICSYFYFINQACSI